jgi:AcrR family transcriptional regulator
VPRGITAAAQFRLTASVLAAAYRAGMQLTRKRITATAVDLIEREGVEAASMARLATEIGCGVLPLYGLVPSRTELLDDVADEIVSRIVMGGAPEASWQDQVRALAWAFRQLARVLPRSAVVALSRPTAPASAVKLAQGALTSLRDAGFPRQEAARVMRVVATYVKGTALSETGLASGVRGDCAADTETRRLGLDEDFELGLDLLLHAVGR